MPKSQIKLSYLLIIVVFYLFITPYEFARLQARALQHDSILNDASIASRKTSSLSANIVLTWRVGGITKQTHGTIQLQKPNLARIVLQGDYPELLLVSDGRIRYFSPKETQYQRSPMDATGLNVDSPWWGLPFRYFFTQSVNPFGANPDLYAVFRDIAPVTVEAEDLRSISAQGKSPMGEYEETITFDSSGDLVTSSVRFGEGPDAATFNATLTDIRHDQIDRQVFQFHPATGQLESSITDNMLPLGTLAPSFALPTTEGKLVTFAEQRKGKNAMLINFWYYNCAPCRIEFPEFEKIYRQFKAQGLNVIAINKADSPSVVSNYVRSARLSFTVLLGGKVSLNSVFSKYKVSDAFPVTYLLDANGKIVYRSAGEDVEGLKKALIHLGFK